MLQKLFARTVNVANEKSTKVPFVNSNMWNDSQFTKNKEALNDIDKDEENVYMTNIHDRYASHQESLENMALAKFAVTYITIQN